jgi:hypothetical protein
MENNLGDIPTTSTVWPNLTCRNTKSDIRNSVKGEYKEVLTRVAYTNGLEFCG